MCCLLLYLEAFVVFLSSKNKSNPIIANTTTPTGTTIAIIVTVWEEESGDLCMGDVFVVCTGPLVEDIGLVVLLIVLGYSILPQATKQLTVKI